MYNQTTKNCSHIWKKGRSGSEEIYFCSKCLYVPKKNTPVASKSAPTSKKNTTPLEREEGIALAYYLECLRLAGKIIEYTKTSQETYTPNFAIKMSNKRQGQRKGLPDYIILGKNKLVFIELKRKVGGSVSTEQAIWNRNLQNIAGVLAYICYGVKEAITILEDIF